MAGSGGLSLLFIMITVFGKSVSGICDTDNGWQEFDNSCFYVETGKGNAAVDWHVARERCLGEGADLAIPKTRLEAEFLQKLSEEHNSGYHNSLWLGISNRNHFDVWKFVNGEVFSGADNWNDLWMWGFPRNDKNKLCAYQLHTPSNICYDPVYGIDYVSSAVNSPVEAASDGKNTWLLGRIYNPSESDCELCQQWCHDIPGCDIYSFFNEQAEEKWRKYCIGMRSNVTGTPVANPFVCSGMRTECEADSYWHNDNCGVKRGYACQKPADGGTVAPPEPTPATEGFCPDGFYQYDNKCFLIAPMSVYDGYTWSEALQECQSLTDKGIRGVRSTLASFHSESELSAVAMHLNDRQIGFWIGLYREADNKNWVWTDNSRFDYNKAKYPLENTGPFACVGMHTVPGPIGTWNADDCSNRKGYICQLYKDPDNPIPDPSPTIYPFECEENQVAYRKACYQQLHDYFTWHEAEAECLKLKGHLASIADGAENAAMIYHFTRLLNDSDGLWFGFRKTVDGEWKFVDYYPVGYTNWASGYPLGTDTCGAMQYDGTWVSSPCDSREHKPLCKIDSVPVPTHPSHSEGICPDDTWHPFGDHCYWFSDTFRSKWEAAELDCKGKSSSADLVSIHSYEENQMIFKEFSKHWNIGVWLGRRATNKETPFAWTDGSMDSFLKYMPWEPDHHNGTRMCIAMVTTAEYTIGYWMTASCENHYKYACKTRIIVPPTTPELDTTSYGTPGSTFSAVTSTVTSGTSGTTTVVASVVAAVGITAGIVLVMLYCIVKKTKKFGRANRVSSVEDVQVWT